MFLLSFIIGFIIYSISYYNIGNTLHRITSNGEKKWDFKQLFTTGFIEPIRFGFICFQNNQSKTYFQHFFFQLFNPWFSIPLSIILLHHPLQILHQYLH